MKENAWKENLIVADADYVDRTAFDLIVNFERMLERRIPQADMTRWLECLAMDGGVERTGEWESSDSSGDDHTALPQTQVVLVYPHGKTRMENFVPGGQRDEIDGKAFAGPVGEFLLSAVEEPSAALSGGTDYLTDVVQLACRQPEVRRIMVVGGEVIYNKVRARLLHLDDELTAQGASPLSVQKRLTLFTMQPMPGGPFRQELLGYSLMAALGISGDEITAKLGK